MTIALSYTQQTGGSTAYSVTFTFFTNEDIPRSYVEEANFGFSQSGTAIRGGPSRGARRIWAITSVLTNDEAEDLDGLYKAWAADSGQGISAVVALDDATFGSTTAEVYAVITTAPTFSRFGPRHYLCSIGLTEVGLQP